MNDPFSTMSYEDARNKRLFRRTFNVLFVITLIASSYWLGRSHVYATTPVSLDDASLVNVQPIGKDGKGKVVDFSLFWDAWNIVKNRYVDHDTLDAQTMISGAIDGMLAATGDPYTTFFDEEELASFNEELTGTFEGIGAEIGIRDGILTIIAPLDGAPAEAAGLRAGDLIVKIDDTLTTALSIEEAVNLIRGPQGTQVRLTIYRDGADDTQEIVVTRDEVVVKSVTMEVEEGGIGYIRVRRFGVDTPLAFATAVKTLARTDGVRAVILDLRNNPGGYLDSAVAMASLMLPRGSVVVMSEDINDKRESFYANGENIIGHIPTAVIINEGSASASEILAGALRDNRDDVVLVGRKSFGKGSVQELIPLSRGAVKVTIAKWLTPNGDQINKVGIAPDEDVEMTEGDFTEGRDPQKERAREILQAMIN